MNSERREQIKPLTGLRFIAALLVFIHHIPNLKIHTGIDFPAGAAGVAFFFVLSGFILTYVYEGKIGSWSDARKFWFARWARIWPVHVVTLVACAVCIVGLRNSFSSSQETQKFILNLFLVQTWLPDLQWAMGYNHVSWSIATELFFYALFPLLILLTVKTLRRSLIAILVFCLVSIALGQMWLQGVSDPALYSLWEGRGTAAIQVNPLMRLCEFIAGMLVGHHYLRSRAKYNSGNSASMDTFSELATLMMTCAFLFLWGQGYHVLSQKEEVVLWAKWFQFSFVAIMFIPAIYVFATRKGLISWLLSRKSIVYLGEISFAFYMVHQLVIRYLRQSIEGFWGDGFWFSISTTFVLSIAISAIVYELIEMPLRNFFVQLYRRQWSTAVSKMLSGWQCFLGSRVVVASSISIVATILLIHAESKLLQEYQFSYQRILPVIENSLLNDESINFGGDVLLCGATVSSQIDQGIVVRLVWEKKKETDRHQFYPCPSIQAGRLLTTRWSSNNRKIFVALLCIEDLLKRLDCKNINSKVGRVWGLASTVEIPGPPGWSPGITIRVV